MEEDLEITWVYSPLMVPQHSPTPRPSNARPSPPFNMSGEIIDLTADDDDAGTFKGLSDDTATAHLSPASRPFDHNHAFAAHVNIEHSRNEVSQPSHSRTSNLANPVTSTLVSDHQLQRLPQAILERSGPELHQSTFPVSQPRRSLFTSGVNANSNVRTSDLPAIRPYQRASSIAANCQAEAKLHQLINDSANHQCVESETLRFYNPPSRVLFPEDQAKQPTEGKGFNQNGGIVITESPKTFKPTTLNLCGDSKSKPICIENTISTRSGPFFQPFGATARTSSIKKLSETRNDGSKMLGNSSASANGDRKVLPMHENGRKDGSKSLKALLRRSLTPKPKVNPVVDLSSRRPTPKPNTSSSLATHSRSVSQAIGQDQNFSSVGLKDIRFPQTYVTNPSNDKDDAVAILQGSLRMAENNKKRSSFVDSPIHVSPQKKPRLGEAFQKRQPPSTPFNRGNPLLTRRLLSSPALPAIQHFNKIHSENSQGSYGVGIGKDSLGTHGPRAGSTNDEDDRQDHSDLWKSQTLAAQLRSKESEGPPLTEAEIHAKKKAKRAEAERIRRRVDPEWRERRNRMKMESYRKRRMAAKGLSAHPLENLPSHLGVSAMQAGTSPDSFAQPLLSKDEKHELRLQQRRQERVYQRETRIKELEKAYKRFGDSGSSAGSSLVHQAQKPDNDIREFRERYGVATDNESTDDEQCSEDRASPPDEPTLNAAGRPTTGGKGLSAKTLSLLNSPQVEPPEITCSPDFPQESASEAESASDNTDIEPEVSFAYTVTRTACPTDRDESTVVPTTLTPHPGLHTMQEANALAFESLRMSHLDHMILRPFHIEHGEDSVGMQSWSLTCLTCVIRTSVSRMPRAAVKLPKRVRADMKFPLYVYQIVSNVGSGEMVGEVVFTQRDDANSEAGRVMARLQAERQGLGYGPFDAVRRAEIEGQLMQKVEGLNEVEEGLFETEPKGEVKVGTGGPGVRVRKVRVVGPRN